MFKNLLIIVAAVCGSAQANSVEVSAFDACSEPAITPAVTEVIFTDVDSTVVDINADGAVIDSCALFNNLPENGLRILNAPEQGQHSIVFIPGQPVVIEAINFKGWFLYGIEGADVTFINCIFENCFIGNECGMKFEGTLTILEDSNLYSPVCGGNWPIPEFNAIATAWKNVTVESSSNINSAGVVRCPGGVNVYGVLTNKVEGPLLFTADSAAPVYAAGASQTVVYPQLFGVELADLDKDGVIGFGDQSLVLSRWGQNCGVWNDPNQDGVYNFADLQVISSLWGQTY